MAAGEPSVAANFELLKLYDALPLMDCYKDNAKSEYAEKLIRVAGSRKRKGPDTDILQRKFRNISAPPPTKGTPAAPVDEGEEDDGRR